MVILNKNPPAGALLRRWLCNWQALVVFLICQADAAVCTMSDAKYISDNGLLIYEHTAANSTHLPFSCTKVIANFTLLPPVHNWEQRNKSTMTSFHDGDNDTNIY